MVLYAQTVHLCTNCSFGTWPLLIAQLSYLQGGHYSQSLPPQEQCDINAKTNQGQTALHLAVHQGHARIIERLVGFGVDMNVPDGDGDTALHMAVLKETVENLTQETPQLKKVHVG